MQNIIRTLASNPAVYTTGEGASNDSGGTAGDLTTNVTDIITAVIGALGVVCVVVMIVGGINYMISAGDANKVKTAKNTILYGLIGLVICVLAFAIVNFVISTVLNNAK